MHVQKRSKTQSIALKTLTSALASAVFLSSSVNAAGLGKLTVLSALGQPLRAEIELTATDQSGTLVAKLAQADAFRLANIEFNPALMSLQFSVEPRSGGQVVKISSTKPINEPFVDLLLELSWDSGRLVREYTFLLDPPELAKTQPAQPAQSAVPVEVRTAPGAPVRAPVTAKASAPTKANGPTTEYRVKPGETLGRIAAALKPTDVSLDMMLVALYRANPDAFLGNNMNRLRAGQILTVPEPDTLRSGSAAESRGVVVAHATDFNAYRNKLAGQVAVSTPTLAPQAGQSASGKISAIVEERSTPAAEAKDRLKLSRPNGASGAPGAGGNVEDVLARDKELADATARVRELEKNVQNLELLLNAKGNGVSAVSAPVPVASKPAPVAKPKPVMPAKVPVRPEPGVLDMLMENITLVGAALVALLLGAGALVMRRRKNKPAKVSAQASVFGQPSVAANSLFAETGGQSVDTNNSVFNSSFAPSASQLDTNEVDPVAEADVYIAYGRDAQAEEILKEALRTHPERQPVRLKLLEIYANRKDLRAFENTAVELFTMSKGQGDEWLQAATLGLTIDPHNPLYASAAQGAASTPEPHQAELDQQALLAQQLEAAMSAPSAVELDLDLTANAAPPAPTPAVEDDHSLDFDLGGLGFEPTKPDAPVAPVAKPAPVTMAKAEPPAEVHADLAFNMDFDIPAAPASAPPAPSLDEFDLNLGGAPEPVAPALSLDDFDLDLGAPVRSAAASVRAEPESEFASLDLTAEFGMADLSTPFDLPKAAASDPLMDLDAMNVDLPTPSPVSAAAASASASAAARSPEPLASDPLMDLDAMNVDLPAAATPSASAAPTAGSEMDLSLDDPFAAPEQPTVAPASPVPKALPFDLSGIDLDLPGVSAAPEMQEETLGAIDESAELSALHMEMETKLDLALAYQEIGDKEGARELIDEVIKDGNAAQVAKATAVRAQLV